MEIAKENNPPELPPISGVQWVLLFVLFVACCFTRLYALDYKAIMHDEGLFVYYTWDQLFRSWNYVYLPILHGPAMLHLQAFVFHLFGDSTYTMRLGCALLGIGGFGWIWKLRPWLGAAGVFIALTFYTISPGITFYQRFFRNDSLYLFNSLWIVTSLAWWWRTRNGKWLASAVLAVIVLFTNKESSLFVYFSVFTFFILLALHDIVAWVFQGRDERFSQAHFLQTVPKFRSAILAALIVGIPIVLALTQIFEGLTYRMGETGTVEALGHDWVLKDIYSIPIALGWLELTPAQAPDASASLIDPGFWRAFYIGLFGGLFLMFLLARQVINGRIGHRILLADLWAKFVAAKWYFIGALGLGMFLYLYIFNTGFLSSRGFFEIYNNTWAYWGGQHELGRIGGPFHQHTLNMVVYELPALLIVLGIWLWSSARMKWDRTAAFAFVLIAVAAAGFHKFVFSGLQYSVENGMLQDVGVDFFKHLFFAAVGCAILSTLQPKAGRILLPAYLAFLFMLSVGTFTSDSWETMRRLPVYKHGEPVYLVGRHVNLANFMEIQFNFDAGWNLTLVMTLVVFASVYAWKEIGSGRRFRAFLIWWVVTATGAASYAREAVPQVGIHAMLPLILLAGSYADALWKNGKLKLSPVLVYGVLGVLVMWNIKATVGLNFYRPDAPVERMVYGHISQDLRVHSNFVLDYVDIASVKSNWVRSYNDPVEQKDVRVGVETPEAIWPIRWYLRHVFWREVQDPEQAIDERWEFLFLKPGTDLRYPEVAEDYHLFRGVAIRFWQPQPVRRDVLFDYWKTWIPGHYLDGTPRASEAYNARQEWQKLWDYLWRRKAFAGAAMDDGRRTGVSGAEYIFAVRKDLY